MHWNFKTTPERLVTLHERENRTGTVCCWLLQHKKTLRFTFLYTNIYLAIYEIWKLQKLKGPYKIQHGLRDMELQMFIKDQPPGADPSFVYI